MDINSSEQIESASKTKSNFIDIPDGGKVTVRLVSDVKGIKEHKVEIAGKHRFIICPVEMNRWEADSEGRPITPGIKCPVCQLGKPDEKKIGTKFMAIVIDTTSKVGVLKKGKTVFGPMQELIENGYALSETPVIISRKGEGLETKYSVIPSKTDLPLTDEEKQAIEDFKKDYDLDAYSTPMSYENIQKKLRGETPVFEKADDLPIDL
jgi:hypothetical protein